MSSLSQTSKFLLKTCFQTSQHMQSISYSLPSNKKGTWVILYWRLWPLISCSWTIQQVLLPGDQYIISSAAWEHSLWSYVWHVVTGLHAAQLFIQTCQALRQARLKTGVSAHYEISTQPSYTKRVRLERGGFSIAFRWTLKMLFGYRIVEWIHVLFNN